LETTTPVATDPTATNDPSSPWKLIWGDEFDGKAGTPPDPSKWTAKVGGGGWGNQQLDYDTNNQNVYQDGQGNLVLEARQEDPAGSTCWYGPCKYTSAQITTQGHFSYTYGLIEARMKIPSALGVWSSFWLLGDNCAQVGWPTCGEIDIMENINTYPNVVYGTVHGPGYSTGTYQLKSGNFSDDFHVFGLQWDPNHLYFMVDGTVYHTVDRNSSFPTPNDWVYDHPFDIVLNLPVGGVWPGSPDASTVFPQRIYVSYIRVYTSK
jgi:beta-glucanase (GH16 family)